MTTIIIFKNLTFEVDIASTKQTYKNVSEGGADSCSCNDCKNYVAYRDKVFPREILALLNELGIDYKKEVEICSYETLPNGLHHITGWFHFKGQVLKGKDCRIAHHSGGYSSDLKRITDNFSIGFTTSNDLAFFDDKTGLVRIEFDTYIPWVIDKALDDK